jgi:hypothetical protein
MGLRDVLTIHVTCSFSCITCCGHWLHPAHPMQYRQRAPCDCMHHAALSCCTKRHTLSFSSLSPPPHPPSLTPHSSLLTQVTNPPIDPLREGLVMSLEMRLGARANLLQPGPEGYNQILLKSPILLESELAAIQADTSLGVQTFGLAFEAGKEGAMEAALRKLCADVEAAVRAGCTNVVLTDRVQGEPACLLLLLWLLSMLWLLPVTALHGTVQRPLLWRSLCRAPGCIRACCLASIATARCTAACAHLPGRTLTTHWPPLPSEMESGKPPIPALLATGAVHHHLIATGLRSDCSIVVETSTCFSTHHAANLIGYGAHAICPYLAYETCRQWRMSSRTQSLIRSGKVGGQALFLWVLLPLLRGSVLLRAVAMHAAAVAMLSLARVHCWVLTGHLQQQLLVLMARS